MGGNVSTNAGGMRAVKYGVTRDYVLAMTVVLPDGQSHASFGKTVCKTSSGYSLLHLMIGSEGTLGVITELTLKLIPKPEMNVSLILPFADAWRPPSPPCRRSSCANLDPQSIEFMERGHRRFLGGVHRQHHLPHGRGRQRGGRVHPRHPRR